MPPPYIPMEIIIEKMGELPVERSPVEIVERKGLGHPDTLCDRAAEEVSIAFSRYYLKNFGRILHHNVDKCLLVGGRSEVRFGGGRVVTPLHLTIAGRAVETVGKEKVPLDDLAREATYQWMGERLRFLDPRKNVTVETKIRTGSVDLRTTFDNVVPLANDTSVGVGFAPLTETESLVYQTEQYLNSREMKRDYPMIGEDVKVMGIRRNDTICLTVAAAFVSKFIPSKDAYFTAKAALHGHIHSYLNERTGREVTLHLNAADSYENEVYYLTVTGTSAECGDDGQVGRGNRANGLITPCRPMTLEATAGKNPVTHTGKIYNIAANEIAAEISAIPDVSGVECSLVSRIGAPITEPQIVHARVHSSLSQKALEKTCRDIITRRLHQIPKLWVGIMERRYSLF